MRIHMQTSLLEEFRQEYRLLSVLGGLGGRRDVTGVGKPSEDLQDPSADVGNLQISTGASHYYVHFHDLRIFKETGEQVAICRSAINHQRFR